MRAPRSDRPKISTKFFIALWGLLVAKCLTLEFLARHYDVPVSTLGYVWAPSFFMATLATLLNKQINWDNFLQCLPDLGIKILAISVSGLLILRSLALANDDVRVPLLLAVLLLAGHSIYQSTFSKDTPNRWKAFVWSGGLVSALFAPANVIFLIIACCVSVNSVYPWFSSTRTLEARCIVIQ